MASVKSTPVLQLKNVSKIYSEYGQTVNALDKVSIDIDKRDFVSIIGPSGSGKSTMLHTMGLLDRPSSGTVFVDGQDTSQIRGKDVAQFRGAKMGFVFQGYNLIPRLTALQNVMLPAMLQRKDADITEKKALSLLKEVGIEQRADHKGVHLSGGEQQRVAIARALINDPAVILADEPTGALDSKASAHIMDILKNVNRAKGVTIAFVTHDNQQAEYADRIITIKDGKIFSDRCRKE
ncbi:MAG: ABC transporter ATP-binding protein [Thermoplasmata archaeon HGW-Thermoplasmata-1]|nr:MAG: ABC transporter ATP-binding protein [Thermoplasmata archaeon HGW-Thermoplasmata-1]